MRAERLIINITYNLTSKGMKEKIAIIGAGHVGLVTGVSFALLGHDVLCTDIDERRISMIKKGHSPFFEAELENELRKALRNKKLDASLDVQGSISKTDVSFICVDTSSNPDGSIDTRAIENAAKTVGNGLSGHNAYHVIVVKSTVIPLTTESILLPILEKQSGKKAGKDFGLCVNPEFLREGNALRDSLKPDRIIIGEYDARSGDSLMKLYNDFECPKIRVDLRTGEMIKYASNAFLAMKVSYANEMANICERFGVDVYKVIEGVGLDNRINPQFMRAGCGFGGSCFPKDVNALASVADSKGYEPKLLKAILELNEFQPLHLVELAEEAAGDLKGKRVALLGLSFKAGTDDVRESRAIPIAQRLIEKGAEIVAYDPRANANFKKLFENLIFVSSTGSALKDADVCIIQNDWQEFSELRPEDFKVMKKAVVIDGRRVLDPDELVAKGIIYRGIGWKNLTEPC
jgi:UDPglucose 6-dehydrogenase